MKKLAAMAMAATLSLTVLAGCGAAPQPSTPAPAPAPAPAAPVTLRLSGWSSSPAETDIVNKNLAAFQAKFPNIKVTYEPVTGDFNQKIQADFAAGTMPDVFYLDVYQAPTYIKNNMVVPIDSYVQAADLADFQPSLVNGFKSGGKLYGLPKGYSTLGLFYNQDMFAKAGIKAPPTTWDELRADAKLLTSGNVVGLSLPSDHARFVPFIYQAGGQLFNADKTQAAFNSPEAVAAASFYTGLITKDKVAKLPKDLGDGWPGDSLAAGHAAMVMEGHWMIPFLKDKAPNLKYGVAELPAGPKAKSNFVFTVAYAIAAQSKHPKEAFDLVNYLTGVEGQTLTATLGLELPSRISVDKAVKIDQDPIKAALLAGAAYAQPFQYTANQQPYVDALGNALDTMILKGGDPKTELDKVQAKFVETMKAQ